MTRSGRALEVPIKPTSASERRGLTAIDVATLIAVAAVVVLVSLPRLRVLARTDNEADAVRTVRELGARLDGAALAGQAAPRLGDLLDDDIVRRKLEDAEALEGGRRLRCHGYLFALVGSGGDEALVAWPWAHGETGRTAFARTSSGELLSHPNPSGAWQGPAGAPEAPLGSGWVPLAR